MSSEGLKLQLVCFAHWQCLLRIFLGLGQRDDLFLRFGRRWKHFCGLTGLFDAKTGCGHVSRQPASIEDFDEILTVLILCKHKHFVALLQIEFVFTAVLKIIQAHPYAFKADHESFWDVSVLTIAAFRK